MADKDQRKEQDRPEVEPYAPPKHPDVHVPEQQFEGNPGGRKKKDESQHGRKDR